MSQLPYPKVASNRSNEVLSLIHSDICGPMKTETFSGKRYFITFIDDFSRFTMVYLLSHKSEALEKFKDFSALVKNKFGKQIKAFRSDNAGEYLGENFEDYLTLNGIERQLSVPFCSPQNGVAERKNRTLVEMARTMLSDANLPRQFWGEAILTATYLTNRLPTKANNNITPFELWNNRKPNLSHIKTFGCKAYAYVEKSKRAKFDEKAIEGIFLGYDQRSKGYRIYIGDNRVMISRSVKFLENVKNDTKQDENNISTPTEVAQIELDGDKHDADAIPHQSQIQLRRSGRENRGVPPDRYGISANMCQVEEPKTWEDIENMKDPKIKNNWLAATDEEFNSLMQNKTWELVDPPPGKHIIGCKWTFKTKRNARGEIERYKARLVAKGYSQKFGCDYDETFAPVVAHTTIRSFLNAAVYKNLDIIHLDVKTAFLHGNLDEEVFMKQPEGYIVEDQKEKVCKLNKAIYGLKQAARAWHLKISQTLKNMGFNQCTSDLCLFKRNKNGNLSYIIVYVDDILVAGKKRDTEEIYKELSREYEIKSLGKVSHYLGINIKQTEDGSLMLDQENKIDEIVRKFNLVNSKPTYTPMNTDYFNLDPDSKLMSNNTLYRQAVGALLYISTITRPDISACVNILGRRNERPREVDWLAVEKVIRYLKTTKDLKLLIDKNKEPVLTAYCDADWASDKSDRKSTTGNIFKLGNNLLSWTSRKQSSVALSSTEAEYISISNTCQEMEWLLALLTDLDLPQTLPISIYEDNIPCIKISKNEKHLSRSKHVSVKYYNVKTMIENGTMCLHYCPSKQMIADIMTKPLAKPQFETLRSQLQLRLAL